MASGLMHTQTSIMLSAAVVPYYGLDRPELAVAAILAGLWAVLVQPDLDQLDNGGYYGLFVLDKTFGRLPVSRLWKWYWMPYARLFAHRSIFTHLPVLGTAGRLIYGGWWFLPFILSDTGAVFLALLIGSDICHFVMDWKLWGVFGLFKQ